MSAVVNPDGTLLTSSKPAEATLAVARVGVGSYSVSITGLGIGACPLPLANAFAATAMYLDGGACGAGSVSTTLRTLDGQDHPFAFRVVGTGAPAAASSGSDSAAAPAAMSGASDWVMLPESTAK